MGDALVGKGGAVQGELEHPETFGPRLSRYLSAELDRPVQVAALKRSPSGFSWITYGFLIGAPGMPDGVRDLVVRLGPSYGLYAPYSAKPQFFALKAVEGSRVPAPRAYLWSDDASILGAPFFIAEKSPGDTPIPWGRESFAPALRDALGAQFADALGALHAIAWEDTDLAELARGVTIDNTALRQLEALEADYRRYALRPHPMAHRTIAWLRENQPVAPRLSIVHGDYRLGNFLEVDGRITAILDWELVHIGDPHEDLAWACLPQYRGGTKLVSKLIERDAFFVRWRQASGARVSENSLRYYTILSLFKLAVTHMAAASAFERNGFFDMRMPAMGTQIAPVFRQIEKALAA